MSLDLISTALLADEKIQTGLDLIKKNQSVEFGVPQSAMPYLAGIVAKNSTGTLIICATDRIAEDIASQLGEFVPSQQVAFFQLGKHCRMNDLVQVVTQSVHAWQFCEN